MNKKEKHPESFMVEVDCPECSMYIYHPMINGRKGLKWSSIDGECICSNCKEGKILLTPSEAVGQTGKVRRVE